MLKLLTSVFGRNMTRKEMDYNKLIPRVFKKIDINGRGFSSLCEWRLYRPLDVQR